MAGLLAASGASTSSAQPQITPESGSEGADAEVTVDGFEVMAKEIAPQIGVSEADVVEALRLQERSAAVVEYYEGLAGSSFAGSWIEHFPDFELIIFTTETVRETTEPAVPTRLVRVENSLSELEAQLESVLVWASGEGVEVGGYVDVRTNSIVVSVDPTMTGVVTIQDHGADTAIHIYGPDASELAEMSIRVPARLEISPDVRSEANVHGGHRIRGGGEPPCTTGFAVQNSAGTKGLLTAGHCGNTSREYVATISGSVYALGNALNETRNANGRDWQWHTVPGHTPTNQIYTGYNGFVTITATTPQSSMTGAIVCRMGIGSGYSCGCHIQARGIVRRSHLFEQLQRRLGGGSTVLLLGVHPALLDRWR
jgi:hypothetical protein